jgi:glycosyltransferase involved in cell wall biosynthesis
VLLSTLRDDGASFNAHMRVTLFAPSAPHPIGGTTAIFEFANGLARRGHAVTVRHADFGSGITPVERVWWHDFHPAISHSDIDPPPGEVVISFDGTARPDLGRPFMWVQARKILPEEVEEHIYTAPCPKLCTSRWLRAQVEQDGVGPAIHVPYGLRHDKYRQIVAYKDRRPNVSMLFNAHPTKAARVGIAAIKAARQHVPDVQGTLFGTSPMEQSMPDWITYLRNPPQERITDVYNQSRVFVQSSIVEGFGLASVEAMACGAALVTTDCGGSRDYADETSAVVVPPLDVDALTSGIVEALTTPRGRRVARAGLRRAREYDWATASVLLEQALTNA